MLFRQYLQYLLHFSGLTDEVRPIIGQRGEEEGEFVLSGNDLVLFFSRRFWICSQGLRESCCPSGCCSSLQCHNLEGEEVAG